jgi:hypothetical protein
MNSMAILLPWFLMAASVAQIVIALLNLSLVRLLGWERELDRLSLLPRQVFHVHAWFVSITLMLFACFSLRFAQVMNAELPCRWMAGLVAAFWAIRTVLQVTYYSSAHWRGRVDATLVHGILLVVYGAFAAVYGMAAAGFGKM